MKYVWSEPTPDRRYSIVSLEHIAEGDLGGDVKWGP